MHKCRMMNGAFIELRGIPADVDLEVKFLRAIAGREGIVAVACGPGHATMFVASQHLADVRTFCQEHNIELVES